MMWRSIGARKKAGSEKWSDAFLMADTPGFPDCNTTMWIDKHGKLWLFWPVILANSWESCLTHYRVSSDYQKDGAPQWEWQGNIPLKPRDFEEVMLREFAVWKKQAAASAKQPIRITDEAVKKRASDKLLSRLGWQPRCKPTVLANGRILLPLYSDTYSAGIMAISDDGGKTWTASQPLAGFGSIQPSGTRTPGRHAGGLHAREWSLQEDPRGRIEGPGRDVGLGRLRPSSPTPARASTRCGWRMATGF